MKFRKFIAYIWVWSNKIISEKLTVDTTVPEKLGKHIWFQLPSGILLKSFSPFIIYFLWEKGLFLWVSCCNTLKICGFAKNIRGEETFQYVQSIIPWSFIVAVKMFWPANNTDSLQRDDMNVCPWSRYCGREDKTTKIFANPENGPFSIFTPETWRKIDCFLHLSHILDERRWKARE